MTYKSLEDAVFNGTSLADPIGYLMASGNLDELYDDRQGHRIAVLHLLVMQGSKEAVEFLINKGANVNLPTSDGDTPLWIAVILGNLDIVRVLVEHGADVNARERVRGDTPLHCALTDSHGDIAQYLLDHGANPDIRNNSGISARQIGLFKTLKSAAPTAPQGSGLDKLFQALGPQPDERTALAFLDLLQTLLEKEVQQGKMSPAKAQNLNGTIDDFRQEFSRPATDLTALAAKNRRLREITAEVWAAVAN